MAGKKRALEDGASNSRAKKAKSSSGKSHKESFSGDPLLTTEEIDFPRGGGTSLTPLEVKEVRAEAVREADSELFSVSQLGVSSRLLTTVQTAQQTHVKRKKSSSGIRSESSRKDTIRIEELNYKARFFFLFYVIKLTVL